MSWAGAGAPRNWVIPIAWRLGILFAIGNPQRIGQTVVAKASPNALLCSMSHSPLERALAKTDSDADLGRSQGAYAKIGCRQTGGRMAIDQPEENLAKALSIIDNTPEMDKVVDRLRDVLEVDHVVYSMARPSAGLYIHLTYPGS
jgi:hypothetical protein